MTTSKNCSVLKDVIAYVDVWSSDKTANYSKPFVQQLQEMGAQVSKTFNKQVTHVVFNNGHLATWKKAKKSNLRLVSVLWVGRCYDSGVHVDEELYPALNESNPVLKNKKHRCMQPKDSPERTPENDRRMRKKLDKMMKDLAPKQPLVTDVSPIIIDEKNGIVYSPGLKRSDYMAQRLKDMKEKRKNLSPTASQMVESSSPPGLRPSLGSTPTVFKLMYDQSDDDSSASVAEPGYSPHEEGRTHIEHCHKNISEKPWLSPCHDVPKQMTSPLNCPDFIDEEQTRQQKSRRNSVRKRPAEEHKSLLESPVPDSLKKSKRRSQIKPPSPALNKAAKGKQQTKAAKYLETMTHVCSDAVNSSSCLSSPAILSDDAAVLSNETAPITKMEERKPKRARLSISNLVRSFNQSHKSKSVASHSTDGDDDVFEDYFSPANHQRSQRPLLPNLCVVRDIPIPLELDPVPKKRKPRRSESRASETNSTKKRKLEDIQSGKNNSQQSDASSESQSLDATEPLPAVDSPSANLTLVAKPQRQSTLPFTRTSTTRSDAVKQRRASTSSLTLLTKAESELQEDSDVSAVSQTVERRGNEATVAAGLTEIPSEGEESHNKQVDFSLQKMGNKKKVMRTLVMTSMPTEKQQTVDQVVKALGGFSIVDRVCESTTHVLSGSQRRTLNILLGIARGCWILSYEWILWCLEQRQWIPEEPYELSDHFPAAQICRLQRHLSAGEHQQDLFQNQPAMFVSQQSQPPTQSLVELIQLCGGTVCKTVRQAGICIGKYNGRRPEGSRILSEQWVLDSITHLKKMPYDNYELE